MEKYFYLSFTSLVFELWKTVSGLNIQIRNVIRRALVSAAKYLAQSTHVCAGCVNLIVKSTTDICSAQVGCHAFDSN